MRGGRRTAIVAASALVVLSVIAAVALAGRGSGSPAPKATTSRPAADATRPPLLADVRDGPLPTAAGLTRALASGLADRSLGGHVAMSILDAGSGRPVLETDSRQVVLPASTAKIATGIAALIGLPATLRLTTRVLAGPEPGEVVLVGAGDPTLAGRLARPGYPAPARLADLAQQVRQKGQLVRRVLVDDSLYVGPLLGPGWRPEYVTGGDVAPVMALMVDGGRTRAYPSRNPRQPDPALAAGQELARLLGAPTATVARGRSSGLQLAAVESPPVPQLVEAMLTRSDNDLAEALARQLALVAKQPASFSGGAAAVDDVLREVLTRVGAGPGTVVLSDGSGLSRQDRVQPGALTRLLAAVAGADRARLFPVLSGLPVAGFDGTLEKRFRRGPAAAAAGLVRAKTGTLNGVSALAGLVRTRDGRLLAFDLTADSVPYGSTLASQGALDRLAATLAACGCR